MRTIIAGSRTITDYTTVLQAIRNSGFEITEIVSGKADGVDTLGEQYAKEHGIPVKEFPAKWNDLEVEGAVIKIKFGRKYNANAGFMRNEDMAKYADALIAITTGSRGTANMIMHANNNRLKIYVENLESGVTLRYENGCRHF